MLMIVTEVTHSNAGKDGIIVEKKREKTKGSCEEWRTFSRLENRLKQTLRRKRGGMTSARMKTKR